MQTFVLGFLDELFAYMEEFPCEDLTSPAQWLIVKQVTQRVYSPFDHNSLRYYSHNGVLI